MATKNHQPSAVLRASAAPPTKPSDGLWLDISPSLGPPHVGVAQGPHGSQGLWLAPGQTQTLQAQGGRRYRLGLRAKPAPTEALIPAEQPVLVLRHGADLWLSNAQAAGLVLNGFFATPENHLDIELGDQAWHVDGLATGQPIAGSEAHLLYWHGQAAHWPDAFNVSTAEGGFELHKTQWQSVSVPGPTAQASTSAATNAATVSTAEAASTTSAATSSAATLTSAEAAASSAAAEAATAATGQAAGTAAAATGTAAPTAAGAAAASAAGTGTAAAAASAAVGVGVSGAAVGAVAVGVAAIAAGTSGKKADTVVATPSTSSTNNTNTNTNNNTNTVTNKAPTAVVLTTALTNSAIAENTSTTSRTKVADIGITDDALGTNTITLTGADAANFEVDVVTLNLASSWRFEFHGG